MSEAAAEDLSIEEELEFEELLEEDEEGGAADEGEGEGEDADPAKAKAPPAAPAQQKPEKDPLAEVEARNRELQGWAAKMRHENRGLQERLEKGEKRMERILSAIAKAQGVDPEAIDRDPEEAGPDPDEDIVGAIAHKVKAEVLGPLQERFNAEEQDRETKERIEGVKSYHERDIAAFEQQYPDYDDAERFVIERTADDIRRGLRAMHPRAPESWIEAEVQGRILDTVARHQLQFAMDGASLAEHVYRMAVENGYQPGGGKAPARKPTKAEDLKRRRAAAGTSLAAVSGSPGVGGKSLARLADMDDDEFDAAVEKLESGGKSWEKIAAAVAGGA